MADARLQAQELAVRVARGEDPARQKRNHRDAETVQDLCRLFLELHSRPNKKASSSKEDERLINREIVPRLGKLKASTVRRRDVIALLDEIRVKRGAPVMSNRVRALVHSIYNFALQREIVDSNPCAGLPKIIKEKSRDRFLSEVEIRLLFEILDEEPDLRWSGFYKLLLYTGQRPGEVLGLRWGEIQGNVWTIPAERSKNGQKHRIHLTAAALTILERIRAFNAALKDLSRKEDKAFYDDLVFPSRYGSPLKWLSHKTPELVSRMKVEHWTAHDLRRTVATHLENNRIPADVIDAIQNHKKQGIKAVYQRGDRWVEIVEALETWSAILERILTQPSEHSIVDGEAANAIR